MTNNVRWHVLTCAAAAVTALGVIGCNDEDDAAPAAQPAAQQPASPPARQTAPPQSPVSDGAAQPSGGARDTAPPAADASSAEKEKRDVEPTPTETAPPATPQPQPPQQRTAPPAQRPSGGAPAPSNDPQVQARELIDQVRTNATNMQWKEADQALSKLKTLRGKVPEDLRVEIDNAETFFKAQKAINNVK